MLGCLTSYLSGHMMIPYTENKRYKCYVCGITFSSVSFVGWATSSLIFHLLSIYGYSCPENLITSFYIQYIYYNSKTSIYQIFRKVFPVLSSVKKHRRTHSGKRPYECNYCGKFFTSNGYLSVHMRTHIRQM